MVTLEELIEGALVTSSASFSGDLGADSKTAQTLLRVVEH
jgi:hypothetical protein